MSIFFLDTEFTDLVHPELLSLGLVTLDGREHYTELDLSTHIGQARRRALSAFVRLDGVLDTWGRCSRRDSDVRRDETPRRRVAACAAGARCLAGRAASGLEARQKSSNTQRQARGFRWRAMRRLAP